MSHNNGSSIIVAVIVIIIIILIVCMICFSFANNPNTLNTSCNNFKKQNRGKNNFQLSPKKASNMCWDDYYYHNCDPNPPYESCTSIGMMCYCSQGSTAVGANCYEMVCTTNAKRTNGGGCSCPNGANINGTACACKGQSILVQYTREPIYGCDDYENMGFGEICVGWGAVSYKTVPVTSPYEQCCPNGVSTVPEQRICK